MKKALLSLIFLLPSISLFAQHLVKGTITDSIGSPLDAAVVVLMNPENGNAIRQGITSPDGTYTLNATGNMQIYISSLGFQSYISQPFYVASDTVIPTIRLHSENFKLDEVVVVGEKQSPSIKIEKGKMIFIPKNSSIVAGSTALEVLKKTPGVFVDGENNISIGGKNNVLVILNGKQTYMQKDELVTLLKATPSAEVASVEVIHNPSAQYDAEGSGGIININMNRKKSEGFFFSINNGISYWKNLRENTELSFSYTQNKISLSGSYNHAFGYYDMDYGMQRVQNGKDYYSPTQDTDKRKTISGSLNLEYALTDKQTIGGHIDINTLFGPGQTHTITKIRDAETHTLEQTLYAGNDYYKQKGNRYGGNLYYTAIPKEGVSYTADFNYAWFDGGSGNLQPNTYVLPNGTVAQDNLYKSVNSRNIHIYALSYDQQHPLWNGEVKSGIKFSSVNADNGYQFYNVADGAEIIDASQSNDFRYKEQILAAYILYTHSIGEKFSLEAGLRGEYTFSDGKLHAVSGKRDEENERDYFNLFPTFNLNYQINDHHALTLSYASRIDRPAYQDLNPFEYLLDELSYWKGNPFLTPQKTHRVAVTYSHKRTALTASYSYMKDYKAQITDTLSVNKVIMTPRNIGKQQRISLTLFQGITPTQWWEMNLNLIGYYVKNDIVFDRFRLFNLDGFAGIFSIQNTIRLPWQIQMELNGSYSTKRLGASNEYIEPSGYVDIGFSKSFANRKWTINLAMSDIFWTNRWDNYSSFSGFKLWNWGKSESRQVKLNITYRFGREKSSKHSSHFNEIDRL